MSLKLIRKRLWQILEKGNEEDRVSVYTDIFLITLNYIKYYCSFIRNC